MSRDKDGRPFGDEFMQQYCTDIDQDLVYEIGTGPSEKFWSGRVERFDYGITNWWREDDVSVGKTEHIMDFEDLKPNSWPAPDVVSSVWSFEYSKDPLQVLRNAQAVLKLDGHLLLITRTAHHKKDSYDGPVPIRFLPSPEFLMELPKHLSGMEEVEFEMSEDQEFFAGLYRRV